MTIADHATVTAAAADVALKAAIAAGVRIVEIDNAGETVRAAALLQEIWRAAEPPVPASVLRAIQDSGGYVFGGYDLDGRLLGTSAAFLAAGASLHSHITGVLADGRRRGLGIALKRHQRAWALDRELGRISWTSDPLVTRNVIFNSHALGAAPHAYRVEHYGPMPDGLNAHDHSDRLEWHWDLTSERTLDAARGRIPLLSQDHLPPGACTISLPKDIETLRLADPDAGLRWRLAVRGELRDAMDSGLALAGVTMAGALVMCPAREPAR